MAIRRSQVEKIKAAGREVRETLPVGTDYERAKAVQDAVKRNGTDDERVRAAIELMEERG